MKIINREFIRVYKIDLAIALFNKGYKIIKIEKNIRQPQKTVFYFKNENELSKAIDELRPLCIY